MDRTRLLSVDPGVNSIYVATWCGQELRTVGETTNWMLNSDHIVIECPTLYQGRVVDTDQRDILNLVRTVERVKVLSNYDHWKEYLPRDWKGQDKKWITHHRVLTSLTDAERKTVKRACGEDIAEYVEAACVAAAEHKKPKYSRKSHNLLDAVGIGLHHLGRLK